MDLKKPFEPVRAIPTPEPDLSGVICGSISLSPTEVTSRSCLALPPVNVLPIIVVPGIMGSNLCATAKNAELKAGAAAWRPPNGKLDGLAEADVWKERSPTVRQKILDPDTLIVDTNGPIKVTADSTYPLDINQLRLNGWGEIHWDSYGHLLEALQRDLNTVFEGFYGPKRVARSWYQINDFSREEWGAKCHGVTSKLTEAEFKKLSSYFNPVYAFGYNWLKSNAESSEALEARIVEIIDYWQKRRHSCRQVVLVTHSMGGLVARACAKRNPARIAGIVHSVMPALGAPVCYRRIACGTEDSSPSNNIVENYAAGKFAIIAGRTPAETTPVMATAPGPLELLPNHRYPGPWLFATVKQGNSATSRDLLRLPIGDPYQLYRNTTAWYRLADPVLADPADRFKGQVLDRMRKAIKLAEMFHKSLDEWYHPNSYAIYCSDAEQLSFGTVRWSAVHYGELPDKGNLETAQCIGAVSAANRAVQHSSGAKLLFRPSEQDAHGDGTVPEQSGKGPHGKVKQVFRTSGYDHQKAFQTPMLSLTLHLIAKIVQEAE